MRQNLQGKGRLVPLLSFDQSLFASRQSLPLSEK